jgi:hypothetical protein
LWVICFACFASQPSAAFPEVTNAGLGTGDLSLLLVEQANTHVDMLIYRLLCPAALALAALRQRAARLAVAGASTLQAASGGPGAALKFEGPAWNSSTVSQIAMAKAHTEMVLLQVGVRHI